MQRAIEEHLARGEGIDEAFDAAMQEETAAGLPEEPTSEVVEGMKEEFGFDEADDDEPWKESLPEAASRSDEDDDITGWPRHPLQRRAMDLMLRLDKLLRSESKPRSSHQDVLLQGAGDMMGGLAQALGEISRFSSDDEEDDEAADEDESSMFDGLAIVQLKRTLRGAAFALGALLPLRAVGTLDEAAYKELRDTIRGIEADTYAELTRLRQRRKNEEES